MHEDDATVFSALQETKYMWLSLLSSVYLIVLIEALREMEENSDLCSGRKWFKVIEQELANKKIKLDKNNIVQIAQNLLDNPNTRNDAG